MDTYVDIVEKVLNNIKVLDVEEKSILKCPGQVLAENVYATTDLPVQDSSGPDGYAVRYSDIKNATKDNPVTLRIIETVKAGSLAKNTVNTGTAIRIMTGCLLPEGADCVIRFEDTDEPGDKNGPNLNNPQEVKIFLTENPENNIRKTGSEITSGTLLLSEGSIVGPAQISTLLTIGKATVRVIRRPVVAVISTGDELVNVNSPLLPGKVYDCNTAAVSSLIIHYGGIPKILGIARDNEKSLLNNIRKAMSADIIITSGGVSRGDYDLVRLILEKMGRVIFSRIPMGPGGSFTFGAISRQSVGPNDNGKIPFFALSGPPVGCINNMDFFVRPAIYKMRGLKKYERKIIDAVAGDAVINNKPIPFIVWTTMNEINGSFRVTLNSRKKSGYLASMALANSLTIIPPNGTINPGDTIKVMPFDWTEDYRCT